MMDTNFLGIVVGVILPVAVAIMGFLIKNTISSLKTQISSIGIQNKKILDNQETAAVNSAVMKNQITTIRESQLSQDLRIQDNTNRSTTTVSSIAVLEEWKKHTDIKLEKIK